MRASSTAVRFGRRRRLPWWVAVVLLLAIAARVWDQAQQPLPPPDALPEGEYQVERVVDGDTLLLANGARVRLQGVDTREVFERGGTGKRLDPPEPWGPEASEFTKKFIGDDRVRLQFDKERQDKFKRYLAYVWVGDKMLNEELLRTGLAEHTPWYNYAKSKKDRFDDAEQEAKRQRRGIWSEEDSSDKK